MLSIELLRLMKFILLRQTENGVHHDEGRTSAINCSDSNWRAVVEKEISKELYLGSLRQSQKLRDTDGEGSPVVKGVNRHRRRTRDLTITTQWLMETWHDKFYWSGCCVRVCRSFLVEKSEKDWYRLIVDARNSNLYFSFPSGVSMKTSEELSRVEDSLENEDVDPGELFRLTNLEDAFRRSVFCRIKVSKLCSSFVVLLEVKGREVGAFLYGCVCPYFSSLSMGHI